MKFGKILGIDLGTTNSVITVWDSETNEYTPIKSLEGRPLVPSALYIKHGVVKVGDKARDMVKTDPDNVVLSVKSHMSDNTKRFTLIDALGKEEDEHGDLELSPVEVTSYILKYIKKSAETYMGDEINEVVITVPAYFREVERKLTARAAEKAGLNTIEIINEPTSACLAYGYANSSEEDAKKILVYDLGGGTFDVTLLEMSPDMYEVLDTDGDKIGGDDLDNAFVKYLIKEGKIKGEYNEKLLKMRAEEAKIRLSDESKVKVKLSDLGGKDIEVTKGKFEKVINPIIQQTMQKVKTMLDLHQEEIDEVVLVGGSTKIPYVKTELAKLIGLPKDYFDKYKVDPDLAVSIGACIRGRIILGDTDIVLIDRTPFNLGVELDDGKLFPLINSGAVIPTSGVEVLSNKLGVKKLRFKVYQGNEVIASKNQFLGKIEIDIDTSFFEIINFRTEFKLDMSGLLTVEVTNLITEEKEILQIKGAE